MLRIFAAVFIIITVITAVNFNSSAQDLNALKTISTSSGYEIEFSLPDYNITSVNAGGEQFDIININSFGVTSGYGKPMLPQLTFILILNKAETLPEIKILNSSSENLFLSRKVYPAQEPWEKNKPYSDRPFTINRAYYNTTGSIADPVISVSDPFIMAGVKAVMVTVNPFRYDPSSGKLEVIRKASFNIRLLQGKPLYSNVGSSFRELFNSLSVNSSVLDYTGTNNYLIITPPDYESTIGPFAAYKSSMGYNVFVANTSVTGTTTTAIMSFIQDRYNNISTRPEYILLVGDIDKVPEWTGGGSDNPHTDLNYTLLEGSDLFADAFIGRFPVSGTAELTNMINKTMYMEGNIGSFTKKNVLMASTDNWAITEGTHNFVIDSFLTSPPFTNLKLYTHTYSATTQQLIDALNNNQVFAIYSGHGSTTSWADGPPLNQSQVNALNNSWYPFVYSFACLTGQYQNSECFGETWVRRQKAGSVFWGSSVNSFWDEDDILERRLFRAMFTDGIKRTAPMFVMAKLYLVQHYGSITSDVRRYLEMYNCMGDPSIYQAAYGPVITHTCMPNTENLNGPYNINCTIIPAGSSIDPAKTKLFWTRGSNFTDSIAMTNSAGNNWSAAIPGNGSQAVYKYYIKTCDMLNRTAVLPIDAPAVYFSFTAAADLTPPQIVHSQLIAVGQPSWPVTINSNVTDNIGVDSVWVEWYKNTPSVIKQFRLTNTGGSVYSAVFNSVNNEVIPGDSIFYRIKARDISSSHNQAVLPQTGYFGFIITAQSLTAFCKDTYMPIRDNQVSYDTLYVAEFGEIVDFNFKMESLIHTWDGDLSLSIISPTGVEVSLSDQNGSSGDNYINTVFDDSAATPIASGTAPFTGNFKPESPVSVFNGLNVHGNWILKVNDQATGDTGRVNRYCLNIIYNAVLAVNNEQVPVKYALCQNYPNPFNPVTTIKYSVPKQSLIKIAVYDILGREVKILVNEVRSAGNYEVKLDGTNLASGVYFYRMTAGDFTEVKKLVMLK